MKNFIVSEDKLRKNDDGTYTILADSQLDLYVPPEYTSISPMDGRYRKTGEKLSPYFSEFALVRNRVKVEVLWLQYLLDNLYHRSEILAEVNKFDGPDLLLTPIYKEFDYTDFFEIKEIEKVTNHDVKSVELWVAKQLKELGHPELVSFVHIGCTSEDITNPSYARMIKDALDDVWIPAAKKFVNMLDDLSLRYKGVPMLAHTHGQPATPTTMGKEFFVSAYRLHRSLSRIEEMKVEAKFNGATGNYAAISVAFPEENWPKRAEDFVRNYLGLEFNPVSTQIEPHDYIVEIAAEICHFNRISANFCADMWSYISRDFIKQVPVKSEVGSSTMPHKVNPIDFENSEANFRKSTADFEFLEEWLMSSRMQRDLRDSTILRNLGPAFAHSLLGIERVMKGLKKVDVNDKVLMEKLDDKWEVLAEAIQTVLRKYGVPDAYDKLKELTRGKGITQEALHEFVTSDALNCISASDRDGLIMMRPEDYIGYAPDIVDENIF